MNKTETVYSAFLLSIIRHLLSLLAGVLVTHGFVTAELANKFSDSAAIQITASIILFLTTLWFSYKDKIWAIVKTKIGIKLPPTTTIERVVAISKTVENKSKLAKGEITTEQALGQV